MANKTKIITVSLEITGMTCTLHTYLCRGNGRKSGETLQRAKGMYGTLVEYANPNVAAQDKDPGDGDNEYEYGKYNVHIRYTEPA